MGIAIEVSPPNAVRLDGLSNELADAGERALFAGFKEPDIGQEARRESVDGIASTSIATGLGLFPETESSSNTSISCFAATMLFRPVASLRRA